MRVYTIGEVADELEATHITKGYTWSMDLIYVLTSFCKNNYIVNNLSENFNAWILEARYLPAMDLVDIIRIKIMVKMHQRNKLASKWKGVLVPLAEGYVRELSRQLGQGGCVRRPNDCTAKVERFGERHVLDLVNKTCTCKI